MFKLLRKKEGSFVIFALMLFTATLIMLIALIDASADLAVKGSVNSFGILWSKNMLGKYDLYLKERYGILGFYGNDYSVEEDIRTYSDYSFKTKAYIKTGKIESDSSGYNLSGTKQMEKAVIEAVTAGIEPVKSSSNEDIVQPDRTITAEWIIKALPSYGTSEELYLSGLVKQIKAGLGAENLIKKPIIDKYIFTFFKDYMDDRDLTETYFSNEIEYIISGKLSDVKAKKSVETSIKVMRNLLNLYYLYSCPEKRQGALALAETLTPGPAAVLTQAVILETWAYQEAENDINILYEGGSVPLIKKDTNWALTLDNVFNEDGTEKKHNKNKSIKPDVMEGEKYDTYLAILLCGLTNETKLLRIMDLIQINGKYSYCAEFLLNDYCNGIKYSIEVNGHTYKFEDKY
ncbi:MAG: hypothetical protein IJP00_06175 [Firmicutes bacterium]|nr:hypothetical protein [Bacillota bacterium]